MSDHSKRKPVEASVVSLCSIWILILLLFFFHSAAARTSTHIQEGSPGDRDGWGGQLCRPGSSGGTADHGIVLQSTKMYASVIELRPLLCGSQESSRLLEKAHWPSLVTEAPLLLTSEALSANFKGTVLIDGEIGMDGRFKIVQVLRDPGFELAPSITETLERDWKITWPKSPLAPLPVQLEVQFETKWSVRQAVDEHPGTRPFAYGNSDWLVSPSPLQLTPIACVDCDFGRDTRVVLQTRIRANGTVEVTSSSGELNQETKKQAIKEVETRWLFRPAALNGSARAVPAEFVITFPAGARQGSLSELTVLSPP